MQFYSRYLEDKFAMIATKSMKMFADTFGLLFYHIGTHVYIMFTYHNFKIGTRST